MSEITPPPQPTSEPCKEPLTIEQVLSAEEQWIETARKMRKIPRGDPHRALCLSGGGIRSATFNLGLLQAMAHYDVLKRQDYLSTVSGGGFIGSWMEAWIHRCSADEVFKALGAVMEARNKDSPACSTESPVITHLRRYSNYLAPKLGVLSGDSLSLIAVYLRNLLLNWMILIPSIALALTLPKLLLPWTNWHATRAAELIVLCFAVIFELLFIGVSLTSLFGGKLTQGVFLATALLPLCITSVLATVCWRWFRVFHDIGQNPVWKWMDVHGTIIRYGLVGATAVGLCLAAWIPFRFARQHRIFVTIWVVATSILTQLLLLELAAMAIGSSMANSAIYLWLAPATFLLTAFLGISFSVGLTSRFSTDVEREWWARASGWVLAAAGGWLVFAGVALFASELLIELREPHAWWSVQILTLIGPPAFTVLVVLLARNSTTAEPRVPDKKTPFLPRALPAMAILAVICIVAGIAIGLDQLIQWSSARPGKKGSGPYRDVEELLLSSPFVTTELWAILFLCVAVCSSHFINVNKFSLHFTYRNRLIRAYVGASREAPTRNHFIGMDDRDNLRMYELTLQPPKPDVSPPTGRWLRRKWDGYRDRWRRRVLRVKNLWRKFRGQPVDQAAELTPQTAERERKYELPFLVINSSLNLVSGSELAWQQRKAASFTITPLHCGSAAPAQDADGKEIKLGFRDARLFFGGHVDGKRSSYPGREYGRPISLGNAVTISGAAVSPNQGYHSNGILAFLLTFFNVRTGLWVGNPDNAEHFSREHPPPWSLMLFREVFGLTDEKSPYLYLSDGGHFENLGIYEMVRRKCRWIIASDAGCDPDSKFDDLGNAVRKIRTDLGVHISFREPFAIRARNSESNGKAAHFAIGIIHYATAPSEKKFSADSGDGLLLYIKASYYDQGPRDVCNYATSSKTFPHETTADQFFTESQFESYRALGAYVGEVVFDRAPSQETDPEIVTMLELLGAKRKDGASLKP